MGPEAIDLALQFQDMATHGVDAMVCSPGGLPGIGDVTMLDLAEGTEICQSLNRELSDAQRAYPDRVVGLCVLPLQDTPAALAVLDEAILDLNLRGVCVHSNINGHPIATPETEPIFARIADLGVPVVLHPTLRTAMSYDYARYGALFEFTSWMFDTSVAALSLIMSGRLDANPSLQIVHPHVGGTLPYITGRIDGLERIRGREMARPTAEYLRANFYADSVTTTPGALDMAATTYGEDRIVYASDFPWIPRGVGLAHIRADMPPKQADRLLDRNFVPGLRPELGNRHASATSSLGIEIRRVRGDT